MTRTWKHYLTDVTARDRVYRILFQIFLFFYVALLTRPANYIWVALVLFWLTEPGLSKKVAQAFRNKLFLAVILVYAVLAVSLFYSADWWQGIKRLETRVGIFVFPMMLGTIVLSRETVVRILKAFVWACAVVAVVGLLNSIYLFSQTGESVYLYSDNLLILIQGQAIYFALYLNVAILFIVYLLMRHDFGRAERLMSIVLLPFFAVMIFLLAGRISLAVFGLMVVVITIVLIVKRRMYVLGFSLVALSVVAFVAMSFFFPKTINRFRSLANFEFDYSAPAEVYHFNEEQYENKWNGLTLRLAFWSCTWEIIKENPLLGTGIGDFMGELAKKYEEKNFKVAIGWNPNPHNLYLEMWLVSGLVGLLVFIVSLAYPAWHAIRTRNYLYLIFLLILSLNMLTEDIFAVYRGAVFFGIFNSLLLFHPPHYPRGTS